MLLLGRILATLSALVLGAHFLRAGSYAMMALALAVVALVYVRRGWALVAVQIAMALGVIEWIATLVEIAAMRQHMGMAYGRMAAILGVVAAVCLAALVSLSARRVREHYGAASGDVSIAR